MYRKMFAGMICLMLLGGTYFVPKVRAGESNKKTTVTINEPIQVPGKVLPAGTYDADETHLITTVQGVPEVRTQTPDKAILQLEERPSGQPEALKAWFYPGDDTGVKFVYPTQKG
jgi:hypothetical protein